MPLISCSGLVGPAKAWWVADHLSSTSASLVICADYSRAEQFAADLAFFAGEERVSLFRSWELLPFERVTPEREIMAQRNVVLMGKLGTPGTVTVSSVDVLMQLVQKPSRLTSLTFSLAIGQPVNRAALLLALDAAGFRRVSSVESVGDVAVRGLVLDIFLSEGAHPLRIEIGDGAIARMRRFDVDSQRTIDSCSEATVYPVGEWFQPQQGEGDGALALLRLRERAAELAIPSKELHEIEGLIEAGVYFPGMEAIQPILFQDLVPPTEYVQKSITVVYEDKLAVDVAIDAFWERVESRSLSLSRDRVLHARPTELFSSPERMQRELSRFADVVDLNAMQLAKGDPGHSRYKTELNTELEIRLKSRVGTGQALAPLKSAIASWRKKGTKIVFAVGSAARADRMRDILRSIDIEAFRFDGTVTEYLQRSVPLEVVIVVGPLSRGVHLRDKKLIFVGEHELFHDRSQRRKQVRQLSLRRIKSSLAQLREAEHVVDREYGVGIYRGLVHRTIDGVQGDFLAIEYADSKLYLPVQHISRVQRFLGADGHKPVLDKLGSQRWARTKQKVRESVVALAGDLLKLYATRCITVGWRFDHRGAEDDRFADGFPYDETPDQAKAIRETLDDMSSDRPMDRLICGDVGFGKTEVAIRAAFKCFEHGRQVVVLVPTTILVEQHKRSFEERFLGYPAIIGAVSRFYKAADNKRVLEDLAKGTVDIIIGTHRLLQHDVAFKDLGLVIIDEEHRFGVKQKERLKQMKANVDVLTLTATPIPRTLHMSLLGIRDVSVIRTPPVDRRPIRTYLAHDDSSVVRDAIARELGRGGQVFFVHNRIQTIGHRAQQLKELFPEARIATAHAKMSEVYLENVMKRFVDHESDILISTSIIESGLDVPRANTIIVDNAHLYGLSQLYQIRGRVGRGTRQSYAYLLVPPKRALSEEARERLKVLQAFDELGAGFQLALRDLEIRGAGNLLGKEQSGSVAAVGFELYTDLLKEAVLNLRGTPEDPASLVDPEVKFAIDAFIPETYIPDVAERLLMYQRLADILTEEDANALAEEIADRFGEPSREIRNLIDVMQFRGLLRQYAVAKGEVAGDRLVLTLTHSSPLNPERLLEVIRASQGTLKLMKGLVLTVQLTGPERTPAELYGVVRDLLGKLRA